MIPKTYLTARACFLCGMALSLILAHGAGAEPAPTAWQSLLEENPDLANGPLGPLERAVLKALTPVQYAAFVAGADPATLILASGESLADLLGRAAAGRLAAKGAVTQGLVYYPVFNCVVASTDAAVDGAIVAGETRELVVRGETTDLSDQGGSDTGCGVPVEAEAIVANFRLFDHDGDGTLKVAASDQGVGSPTFIRYDQSDVLSYANATVVDLCLGATCTSDFRVRALGRGAGTDLEIAVFGYFAPLGTGGLTTAGTTTTGALTITGLDCTGNANGGALTADASGVVSCSDDESGADDQDLFATVTGDAGSTTADAVADTLSVVGSGTVSTAVAGDTLTITGAGDDLGNHTAIQDLDLAGFKLVGNGGSDGLSIAADGTVSFDVPLAGIEVDMGDLTHTLGDPVQVASLFLGGNPVSVFVSGRYAYVVDPGNRELKVIDVSEPSAPTLASSLFIGGLPREVFVAGRYAYVPDRTGNMKVIDVSDPSAPSLAGSVGLGGDPESVSVSGRYAHVANRTGDLQVIDVSDPSAPTLAGSLGLSAPQSVFVSGRYAYVADAGASGGLKVIDVSDPSAPTLAGSLGPDGPISVFVSGRYAYVADLVTGEMKVIDVSDPSAPSLAGSLAVGPDLLSVFASGRYVYVSRLNALAVIDVSDPSAPALAGSLAITDQHDSMFVSGRYAYVVDSAEDDLKVFDLSGAELGTAIVHSMEAGSLQVRESLTAQGQLAVTGGINVGAGGLFSDGNVGVSGTIAIANDIAPTSSPANLVQLYAEDAAGSSELKVRDEAGNVTTLSPHNFSLVGGPSEPLAWSYYSENAHGAVNVDMLRAMRVLERVSGEKLVHTQTGAEADVEEGSEPRAGLEARIDALTRENRELRSELARIKELLGIE